MNAKLLGYITKRLSTYRFYAKLIDINLKNKTNNYNKSYNNNK